MEKSLAAVQDAGKSVESMEKSLSIVQDTARSIDRMEKSLAVMQDRTETLLNVATELQYLPLSDSNRIESEHIEDELHRLIGLKSFWWPHLHNEFEPRKETLLAAYKDKPELQKQIRHAVDKIKANGPTLYENRRLPDWPHLAPLREFRAAYRSWQQQQRQQPQQQTQQ